MGTQHRSNVLFVAIATYVLASAQIASACTCPQVPQVVGDGGGLPANARALFFWTPDLYQPYQAQVRVDSDGAVRSCPSRIEPVGPEALNTLHLACALQAGDELEVTFALRGKVLSRSQLAVRPSAPLPTHWAKLDERPARRFETETDTGAHCSAKSKVFGLQVPIRWSTQSLPWRDIAVLSASIGQASYRRPLSNACDRGFDTPERDTLEVFSRGQGFNKVLRKKVQLGVYIPGESVRTAASRSLNVPAEFDHRPSTSYASTQGGNLADNLSGLDTRRGIAAVYAGVERCNPSTSATITLEVAGATGKVDHVRIEDAADSIPTSCIEEAAHGINFGRFKQARDTISLQLMGSKYLKEVGR